MESAPGMGQHGGLSCWGGHACTGLEQPKQSFPWMAPSANRGPKIGAGAAAAESVLPSPSSCSSQPSLCASPALSSLCSQKAPASCSCTTLAKPSDHLPSPDHPLSPDLRDLGAVSSPAPPFPCLSPPCCVPAAAASSHYKPPLPTGEPLYNRQMMKTSGREVLSARGHICCPGAPTALVPRCLSVCLSRLPVAGAI